MVTVALHGPDHQLGTPWIAPERTPGWSCSCMKGSARFRCGGDWPQRLCNAIGRRGWAYARDGYGRSTRPDVSTAADHVQQGDSARQRVFSVNCRYWRDGPPPDVYL